MSEQIMWAVKGPPPLSSVISVGSTQNEAWDVAEAIDGRAEFRHVFGYRCIRVKVTEVEGA